MQTTSIEFTHPSYLPHILIASALIFGFYLALIWRRNRALRRHSLLNQGRIFSAVRLLAFSCAVALIGLGIGFLLLKPYLRSREALPEYEPLHIVIAVDASLSMLAQATADPCGPSRRDVAADEVDAFMTSLEAKRTDMVGLVVFARFGYRVVPVLTSDYRLFMRVFREVMGEDFIQWGFLQGTNHWDAALESLKVFQSDMARKRVLVILTDGEPDGPSKILNERREQALKALSEFGEVSLYLVGIGDPGTRYPIPLARDARRCPIEYYVQTKGENIGQFLLTAPDTVELGILAEELGGTYRHSRTGSELRDMLQDIVERERVSIGTKYHETYHDLTTYLIWTILTLLMVAVITKSP